jgi:hypothetical protein
VGTEQLIGTIEQVETHDPDPRDDGDIDPWTRFHDELGELSSRLRDSYRTVASPDAPSEQEIRDALGTLAGAFSQVADSVTTALRDPDVRDRLKEAAGALASAVGRTIADLGTELVDRDTWRPATPDDKGE